MKKLSFCLSCWLTKETLLQLGRGRPFDLFLTYLWRFLGGKGVFTLHNESVFRPPWFCSRKVYYGRHGIDWFLIWGSEEPSDEEELSERMDARQSSQSSPTLIYLCGRRCTTNIESDMVKSVCSVFKLRYNYPMTRVREHVGQCYGFPNSVTTRIQMFFLFIFWTRKVRSCLWRGKWGDEKVNLRLAVERRSWLVWGGGTGVISIFRQICFDIQTKWSMDVTHLCEGNQDVY